ncbi:hypothetical protein LTR08_005270 [Meristemomyces frigidus]|nr:hypothetical protein LTR08_005270 [Meristemomyces frigidus]
MTSASLIDVTNYQTMVPDFVAAVGEISSDAATDAAMLLMAPLTDPEDEAQAICDSLDSFSIGIAVLLYAIDAQHTLLMNVAMSAVSVIGVALKTLELNVNTLVAVVAVVVQDCQEDPRFSGELSAAMNRVRTRFPS